MPPADPSMRASPCCLLALTPLLFALAACGPGTRPPPPLTPEPGARWVVGGAVRDGWAGLPWGGSLQRLAMHPDAVPASCSHHEVASGPEAPIILDARDVVWPGAGASLPAWVVLRPTGRVTPSPDCTPQEPGAWIGSTVHGAALLIEGPRAGLPLTPEDADRSRAHTIRAMAGWELLSDGWHPGAAPVAAEQTAAPERALACAPPARAALEAIASHWLQARLASSTPAAEARQALDAQVESLPPAALRAWQAADAGADELCTDPAFALLRVLGAGGSLDAADLADAFGDSSEVMSAVAAVAWSRGQVLACGEALDLAQDRRPDNPGAALLRGRLLRDVSGRDAEAVRAFERAAVAPGWQAVASYEIGLTHEAVGDDPRAVTSYLVAWESDRAFAEPATALGWQAYQRGDVPAAREFFTDASVRDPGHATALANLAVIAEREDNDPLAAQRLYLDALAREPGHSDAHFGLGMLQIEVLGDLEAAEAHLLAAIDAEPTDREAREALERLRSRPTHGVDRLVGLWQAEWVDEAGDAHRSIATVQPDQVWVTVDEVRGAPSRSESSWELVAVRGPQLRIQLTRGEQTRSLIVEWIDDDTTDWFDPDDAAHTRVRWTRWASSDASTMRVPQSGVRSTSKAR